MDITKLANKIYLEASTLEDVEEILEKLIEEAVLEEREECAEECDYVANKPDCLANKYFKAGAEECAIFIRGRTNRTYSTVEEYGDLD